MVKVSASPDGLFIEFPYDPRIVESLRKEFAGAKYQPWDHRWRIPPEINHRRAFVESWAVEWNNRQTAKHQAHEAARAAAIAEGRPVPEGPREMMSRRASEFAGRGISIAGATVTYRFKYNAQCVAIAKSMPGRRFQEGAWQWSAHSPDEVDAIIDGVKRIRAQLVDGAEQAKRGVRGNGKFRHLVRATEAVIPGATIRLDDHVYVVESLGRAFPADRRAAAQAAGRIAAGEIGRYLYCRIASDSETRNVLGEVA